EDVRVVEATLKGRKNRRVGNRATLKIELAVLLFLNSLAEEARVKAFEEKSATIRAQHINAVTKKMLKRARG
uniref:Centromere protein W n=1 Tax=Fundulus heteroclitus TaxID=8078 RepID=A0A3Q2P8B5_FUNHE